MDRRCVPLTEDALPQSENLADAHCRIGSGARFNDSYAQARSQIWDRGDGGIRPVLPLPALDARTEPDLAVDGFWRHVRRIFSVLR